jgi:hypothetical protein
MLTSSWQKSWHSNPNGECMEARWVKSPLSPNDYDCLEARWQNASNPSGSCLDARWQDASESGNCAQARWQQPANPGDERWAGGHVEVRNSKDPDGPVVWYTSSEWRAFLRGVRETDTFDLPEDAMAA